jgi:predicted dienelactone hydrolase
MPVMRTIHSITVLLAALAWLAPLPARAQGCAAPEDPGPYAAGWRTATVTRGSRSMTCQLYYPSASSGQNSALANNGRPYPMIAFGHGFSAQTSYYVSFYAHLASWGYIVIAPQFPDVQHGELALDLLRCLQYLREQDTAAASFLFGGVDTARAGVSGHSMGGGCSLLAASYDARVRIAAPMAPAETSPSAIAVMPSIGGAVCLLAGSADGITPPSAHQQPMYDAAHAFRSLVMLQGGNHTRFMDTPIGDWLDPNGSMTRAEQQKLSRRYMTAVFNLFLRNDTCGWLYTYGSLSSDPHVTISKETKYVAPLPFLVLDPLSGIHASPVPFVWQRARTLNPRDTVSYTVQIAGNRFFTPVLREVAAMDSTTAVQQQSGDPAVMYWRVAARNSPATVTISENYGAFSWAGVPVELLRFSAARDGNDVVLRWATASETGNIGFIVERAGDAERWERIGFVAGAGSTTQDRAYRFTDRQPQRAQYRLRQIDADGSEHLSPAVAVAATNDSPSLHVTCTPSPCSIARHGAVWVSLSLPAASAVRVALYDQLGRQVRVIADNAAFEAGQHALPVPLRNLAAGSYLLHCTCDGRSAVARVLIEP